MSERDAEIIYLHKQGLSYAKIGIQFGISESRVGQIVGGWKTKRLIAQILERKSTQTIDVRCACATRPSSEM